MWDYYITHSEPGPGDNLFINKFISMNNCSSSGPSSQQIVRGRTVATHSFSVTGDQCVSELTSFFN